MNTNITQQEQTSTGSEVKAFLLISAVAIPLLTVLGILSYGFTVWILQIFNGPPTHL